MSTALAHAAGANPGWVELATRAAHGVEVALLWNRSSSRVKVVVSDERVCHHLDFEVDRADALNAFSHPFAHAAARLPPRARSSAGSSAS